MSSFKEKLRRSYWRYYRKKVQFVFQNLGLGWYLFHRWQQLIRLMTNTSVLPSSLLGISGIIISVYIETKSIAGVSQPSLNLSWKSWILIASAAALFLIVFGRYLFKSQTSQFYAEYSIEGRTFQNSFKYIAYCIWKECTYVNSNTKIFEAFELCQGSDGLIDTNPYLKLPADRKKLSNSIKALQMRFMERQGHIQWIDSMMITLAGQMRVPARRLSDYLFQFSPDIYVNEVRSALNAMQQLISICDDSTTYSDELRNRRKELCNRIIRFKGKVNERKKFQKNVIVFKELHPFIIGLSSYGSGLSRALESYTLGLQQISRSNNPAGIDKNEKATAFKLLFFFHKRKLYPGFDLHALLLNYQIQARWRELQNKEEGDVDLDNDAYTDSLKGKLILYPMLEDEPLYKISKLTPRAISGSKPLSLLKYRVPSIKRDTDAYLYEQRRSLSNKFWHFLVNKIVDLDKPEKIIFVTQGYSSVVNKCIDDFFLNISALISNNTAPKVESEEKLKEAVSDCEFHLYILDGAHRPEDIHKVSSRRVLYKFKDNPDVTKYTPESKINVKLGTVSWLEGRFKNGKFLKFLVSGAEFIQIDDQLSTNKRCGTHVRFINDEGTFSVMEPFHHPYSYNKGPFKNYEHIVIGEDHKLFPRPLTNPYFRKAFNSENLEYLNLYPWTQKVTVMLPSLTFRAMTISSDKGSNEEPRDRSGIEFTVTGNDSETTPFEEYLKLITNYKSD